MCQLTVGCDHRTIRHNSHPAAMIRIHDEFAQHKNGSSAYTRACRRRSRPAARAVIASAALGQQKPLVVVGSVNADLVLSIERLPQPGETLGASNLQFFPGGKGANQAAAAAKLGYPTYFVGNVGQDSYAEPLRAALQSAGVKLDHLRSVPGPSGTAVILLQQSGENSIIIVGGANQDLSAWQMTAEVQQLISDAGAVLLQREIPEAVNLQVAQVAAAAGVPVMLDAGGVDAPLSTDLLQLLSLISPNETELQRLTGLPASTDAELLVAAAALQHKTGVQQQHQAQHGDCSGSKVPHGLQVLLKLGTAGSMSVPAVDGERAEGIVRQAAVPAPQIIDTTGAGDCFTAAYVVGVLEGLSTAAAMRFAAAAASICVSRAGAQPSLPSRRELDTLLESSN